MFGLLERAKNLESRITTTDPQILLHLFLILDKKFDYLIDNCEFNKAELSQFKLMRDNNRWDYERNRDSIIKLCEQHIFKFADFARAISLVNIHDTVNALKPLATEYSAIGFFSCLILVDCYELDPRLSQSSVELDKYLNKALAIAATTRIRSFEVLMPAFITKMKDKELYTRASASMKITQHLYAEQDIDHEVNSIQKIAGYSKLKGSLERILDSLPAQCVEDKKLIDGIMKRLILKINTVTEADTAQIQKEKELEDNQSAPQPGFKR